jgi:glycine/serine hydroxymethyltransferase
LKRRSLSVSHSSKAWINRCENTPFDDVDPALMSGLRFGLSACTTRGLTVIQFAAERVQASAISSTGSVWDVAWCQVPEAE